MATDIRQVVKERYGAAARSVATAGSSCCGAKASCGDPITSNLYDDNETQGLPEAAVLASLGCGNPTALAELNPGEVVLAWVGCIAASGLDPDELAPKVDGRFISAFIRARKPLR